MSERESECVCLSLCGSVSQERKIVCYFLVCWFADFFVFGLGICARVRARLRVFFVLSI